MSEAGELDVLRSILESQSPKGAFPSTIHYQGQLYIDWNAFTTAQVLRALSRLRVLDLFPSFQPGLLDEGIDGAVQFLYSCRSPRIPEAYSFWPRGGQPSWIPELPADADDTSVILLELARLGMVDRDTISYVAEEVLFRHRLERPFHPSPPWIRPGAFLTWLDDWGQGMVDCSVNANVVALLSYAGLEHVPGYDEACQTIEDGIIWAGDSLAKARFLTPFYSHPAEFILALENAVQCGARRLEDSLDLVRSLRWLPENLDEVESSQAGNWPIFSSAYGAVFWTSDILWSARTLCLGQSARNSTMSSTFHRLCCRSQHSGRNKKTINRI